MDVTEREPAAVTDADPELAARLRALLPGATGPLTRLEGGRSGLTYRIGSGRGDHVVKAVPPGRRPIGRHDVLRQAVVLRALAGTEVPVPAVTAWDDAEPAWFAMAFADGEAVEPVLDRDRAGRVLDAGTARARMLAAAEVLGRLHAVPRADLVAGLLEAGVEPPEPDGPSAELERWTATMHAAPADLTVGADELIAALGGAVPDPVEPVLVHGDFRLGNLLCIGDRPSALVDWEIWGFGDPRVDLGWFLVFTEPAVFPGIAQPVDGLPVEEELLAAYASARGVRVAEAGADLQWFRALGRMKMAAIMGHNLRRHREGNHHDPVQESLPPTIAALIASAFHVMRTPTTTGGDVP